MKFIATLSYILLIILVNAAFSYAPVIHLFGSSLSSADIIVGVIYITRDFAQRELGHYIIFAMFIGCLLSYALADPTVAFASVISFSVGEIIDWGIYTLTKKPLSKRLLLSSLFSIPIDTILFLYLLSQLNLAGMFVMTLSKAVGVMAVWLSWKALQRNNQLSIELT